MVKQHLLEEKKEKEKVHHKYPVPGVVVLVIVSVFLLYVVIQPLKGQCAAIGSYDQSQSGSGSSSKLPVVCTHTLQPLNATTLTDCDVSDEWNGLSGFCTNAGDCNVKFIVNST